MDIHQLWRKGVSQRYLKSLAFQPDPMKIVAMLYSMSRNNVNSHINIIFNESPC